MEFLEALSLFHLKLRLTESESHQHLPAQLNYINDYSNHNPNSFNNNQNQHAHYLCNELEEYNEDSSAGSGNTSHYTEHTSMAAACATINGKATPSDFVTEQTIIMEATNKLSTIPAMQPDFDELPLRIPTWGIVILVISYLLVFIFGIIGNCCVLIVVARLRRMKTVTNYFIFTLAVADLLVLLFCLLPNLVSNIFVPWVLGWFLCKTVPYIQGVSVCSSIYFLVAISVERCISIQWPFKHQITKRKAKLIIAGIWLWSCIVALPWALFFQAGAFDPDNPHLEFCIEVWPEKYKEWSTYYFLFGNFFICYILPLGVILVCYLTIWFRVYRRSVPSNCYQKAMELIHQRSKVAVIKMFIIVVLFFAISWLPLYSLIIRLKFGKEPGEIESLVISLVFPIAQWLGCFNSCINPVIYSFLNIKFRKAFLSIFGIDQKRNQIKFKHKSPTVNILLKRLSTIQYRVETTMSNTDASSESI